MELPNAPEPIELKQEARLFHQKHPDMNSDSFYIWLVKNLASHLWTKCRWREVLKREGISWQQFERIISLGNFKWWIRGQQNWNKVLDNVTLLIRRYNSSPFLKVGGGR